MEFWVGTYGLNCYHDFLKLFWRLKNKSASWKYYFFSIGAQEQKLCPNKLKTRERGQQKKNWNFEVFFLEVFSHRLYIFLHVKFWFIPFGFVMRKLWTILFFGQLEHLLEKITCRICSWMQFLQKNIKKKFHTV